MVDDRTVYLAPRGSGHWYNKDPGRYHTSESCGGRGKGGPVREVFLERAVKEGYDACGICARGVELGEGSDGGDEG